MSVLHLLSSALGRNDEIPNHDLALKIAKDRDSIAAKEIADNLRNKNKDIQSDCIKVLDDLSEVSPGLVFPYRGELLLLLESKNNRMQWGAMAVLDNLTDHDPAFIYKELGKIISAAEKGSVITKDRCMNILLKLCKEKTYSKQAHELFLEQLLKSLPNQLPMYAENAAKVVAPEYTKRFLKILNDRLPDIEKESKRKRIEKIIRA